MLNSSTAPAAGTWSAVHKIDGSNSINDLSCPSPTLCVAVDSNGNAMTSTSPATGAWSSPQKIDETNFLNRVSCPATTLCVAVDSKGNAIVSADPTGGHMLVMAEWARSILTFQAGAAHLLDKVPWIYKVHIVFGMTLFLVTPFTRLVHIFSAPIWYLARPGYQIVRRNRNLGRGAV